MPKEWKFFPVDCPNCGGQLEVFTDAKSELDDDVEVYVFDGDEVRCSTECGFESCIDVDDDQNATVQDGNIDELQKETNE